MVQMVDLAETTHYSPAKPAVVSTSILPRRRQLAEPHFEQEDDQRGHDERPDADHSRRSPRTQFVLVLHHPRVGLPRGDLVDEVVELVLHPRGERDDPDPRAVVLPLLAL